MSYGNRWDDISFSMNRSLLWVKKQWRRLLRREGLVGLEGSPELRSRIALVLDHMQGRGGLARSDTTSPEIPDERPSNTQPGRQLEPEPEPYANPAVQSEMQPGKRTGFGLEVGLGSRTERQTRLRPEKRIERPGAPQNGARICSTPERRRREDRDMQAEFPEALKTVEVPKLALPGSLMQMPSYMSRSGYCERSGEKSPTVSEGHVSQFPIDEEPLPESDTPCPALHESC